MQFLGPSVSSFYCLFCPSPPFSAVCFCHPFVLPSLAHLLSVPYRRLTAPRRFCHVFTLTPALFPIWCASSLTSALKLLKCPPRALTGSLCHASLAVLASWDSAHVHPSSPVVLSVNIHHHERHRRAFCVSARSSQHQSTLVPDLLLLLTTIKPELWHVPP